MLYLKNALGGLGRSVTDTARHALAGADGAARWRKLALYLVMLALPGGTLVLLLFLWADRRRAQRTAAKPSVNALAAPAAAPCSGGQPACRASLAALRAPVRRLAQRQVRSNDA